MTPELWTAMLVTLLTVAALTLHWRQPRMLAHLRLAKVQAEAARLYALAWRLARQGRLQPRSLAFEVLTSILGHVARTPEDPRIRIELSIADPPQTVSELVARLGSNVPPEMTSIGRDTAEVLRAWMAAKGSTDALEQPDAPLRLARLLATGIENAGTVAEDWATPELPRHAPVAMSLHRVDVEPTDGADVTVTDEPQRWTGSVYRPTEAFLVA